MIENTCKTCKWFSRASRHFETGLCHRYPPMIIDSHSTTKYPRVHEDDWCGEWYQDPRVVK